MRDDFKICKPDECEEVKRLSDLVEWYKTLLAYHGHSLDDRISASGKHIIEAIKNLERK